MIVGNGAHARVIEELFGDITRYFGDFVAIGNNQDRKQEAIALGDVGFCTLIHSFAYVSPSAQIGEGTVIMPGAIVQTGAVIGKHCILNSNSVVEHDCVLGDFVHIAPGAHLCGAVKVGEGALVGVGVGVAPGAEIPAWSICKAARLDICPMPMK